jgi:hypothetical protein
MDEIYANAGSWVSQWRKETIHSVGSEIQHGLRELQRERAQLVDLCSDLEGGRDLVEAASTLHVEGRQLAESARDSAEAAAEKSRALARARDEFLQQRDINIAALQQESSEMETEQAAMQVRYAEAEKLLCTYRERLGLAITREAAHTVRMSFSLLDQADPQHECAFTLGLGEQGAASYDVRYCSPMVPELPELLAELNSQVEVHTALPRFVCSMRRAFAKLCRPIQQKL